MGVDDIRKIVEYNKIVHHSETSKGRERSSPVHSSECLDSELRKIVLYNVRYDSDRNTRSDVDILDEYHYLMESKDELKDTIHKLTRDVFELDNPSTLERLTRTFITWTWSDDPRKNRILSRKTLLKQINEYKALLNDLEFQLPLYRSVVSVTTTVTIKTKSTKLKSKYAKKLKVKK